MKNTALKTAGVLFILMAAAQSTRFCMQVPVVAGGFDIPIWISAVTAVVMLALAVWMFKAAAK